MAVMSLAICDIDKMTTRKKPKDRVPTPAEIQKMAEDQGELYGPTAAALVVCSGLAMCSLLDLSLIRVADLITESGQLHLETTVPAEFSPAGREKLIVIPDGSYLQAALEAVISWRQVEGIGLSGIGTYCQLDPESRFFLKIDGSEFATSVSNRSGGRTQTEPAQLRRFFAKFSLPEGVSRQGLNRAFVVNFYQEAVCDGREADAMKALQALTLLNVGTLRKWITREPRTIEDILKAIY